MDGLILKSEMCVGENMEYILKQLRKSKEECGQNCDWHGYYVCDTNFWTFSVYFLLEMGVFSHC